MKKVLFIALTLFLILDVFSQSSVSEEVNFRFKNRKNSGYYNITQFGLLMGNQPNPNPNFYDNNNEFQISPSVTMINGNMSEEGWGAGIGVGFEIFDRNLFPVFADIRHVLWDNKVSPFFAFKIGHAFSGYKKRDNNTYYKKNGGFMLNPEMGVKTPLSENADLLFTVAYRYQKTKSTVSQNFGQNYTWEHKISMNRLSFGVAIMFR